MPDGSTPNNNSWNRERVDLVKRTICPRGISEDEFLLFMEQCTRSGLDPLLKEAFCVARRQNIGNRERPNWVTKYEFQPSEAGMLARAERFPDFKGIQASAVFAEDEIVVDQGKGEVVHRFNPAKRKGALVGAWSRVVRDGKLPVVMWLDFAGYVQQTPLWAKIPTTMIEKCARVAALRKAYPEAFGGLYVREELPAEEYAEEPVVAVTVETTARTVAAAPSVGTPALPEKTATREAAEVAAVGMNLDRQEEPVAAELRAEHEPVAGQHAAPALTAVVAFGPHKGKTATVLSDDELSETIDLAHEKLLEQPRARWAKAMRENLTALEAEAEVRCRQAPREPGAES
ncbi:phage recombination protein Bet [Corallococcus sp. CA053C]|uniref:phage recombination protein Bet n=1 Tax=Corallococcus sp. CA053C TaxID=2316732 RepID=UPI000EA3D5C7|nr:phage recombination protein Bet [Corallococcus sp. CA053C]RKH12787.1 phage recombination protein Bet [Corallococcus sp. CA053C]